MLSLAGTTHGVDCFPASASTVTVERTLLFLLASTGRKSGKQAVDLMHISPVHVSVCESTPGILAAEATAYLEVLSAIQTVNEYD